MLIPMLVPMETVPPTRAMDQYRFRGQLVSHRKEKKQATFFFRIYFLDSLHHMRLNLDAFPSQSHDEKTSPTFYKRQYRPINSSHQVNEKQACLLLFAEKSQNRRRTFDFQNKKEICI